MATRVDSIFNAQPAVFMTPLKIENYVILNTLLNFHFRRIFYFCLSILTKNMPNLISAKYLTPILFLLQNILILIGIL